MGSLPHYLEDNEAMLLFPMLVKLDSFPEKKGRNLPSTATFTNHKMLQDKKYRLTKDEVFGVLSQHQQHRLKKSGIGPGSLL